MTTTTATTTKNTSTTTATTNTTTVASSTTIAAAAITTSTITTSNSVEQTIPEFKVFIGNLSFKTTKESLGTFAESTGGKVVEATIITKGSRSLGYGFVTFATEKDMKEAAAKLNHKELDGREINVEVARPKTTPAAPAALPSAPAAVAAATESNDKSAQKQRKRNTRRKSKTSKKNAKEASSSDEEEKLSNNKEKKATKPSKDATVSSASSSSGSLSDGDEKLPTHRQKKKQPRSRTKKTRSKKSTDTTDRESSKTTLFVANLPYATTDDDIKKIFEAYKLVSAHVTRMNNGRSKGYGFVEFENEEEQQKALKNEKEIVLDGRSVYLKVALSEQHLVTDKVEALDINDTKK